MDCLNNKPEITNCNTCNQIIDILNDDSIKNSIKPLYAKNLNTHLHFSHGMGIEVVELSNN